MKTVRQPDYLPAYIATTPPAVHLRWAHVAVPLAIIILTIIGFLISQPSLSLQPLQGGIAISTFIGGLYWMRFTLQPGRGRATDIIIPWLSVALLAGAGLLMSGIWSTALDNAQSSLLTALPFTVGLTLLARKFAPTDLCSASSSIGFTGGSLALALLSLSGSPESAGDILLSCAITLAITMGISRIVLCHFIKW